jgi:hypothetical protein
MLILSDFPTPNIQSKLLMYLSCAPFIDEEIAHSGAKSSDLSAARLLGAIHHYPSDITFVYSS